MRALFYQPSCGISGDMHLAAMLELGVPLEHIKGELSRLALDEQFSIEVKPDEKQGINGTCVRVGTTEQHHHRHHSHIADMIRNAGFDNGIEQRALDMFERIARAEASIHNVPIETVHFHEVGAIDSIVDIVAAAVALEYLDVGAVFCNPVEVGAGYVDCAHGRFPVPAPATQELLAGIPCTYGGVQGESTTPTGAAILRASVTHFSPPAGFTPQQIGYGVGHKDFELPNVLRVVLGDATSAATLTPSTNNTHFKIEANIDDMPAEAFEPLIDALFAAGASDVWCSPIVMKKSRSATQLSVLADAPHIEVLADLVLNQSTTIGLRILPFTKKVLPREERWKSEHSDVSDLAAAAGEDYRTVKQKIDFEIASHLTA